MMSFIGRGLGVSQEPEPEPEEPRRTFISRGYTAVPDKTAVAPPEPKPEPSLDDYGDIQEAGFLRRAIPRAKPVPYPPPPPFEMPKYSKVIVVPFATQVLGQAIKKKTKEAMQNTKSKINDLDYMFPNPYEPLINEAVNRHISKNKSVK